MTRDLSKLLQRFESAEREFLNQEFLSPVVRGTRVRVRIDGCVLLMVVLPTGFQGWGVFRPTSLRTAQLIREASLTQRSKYLSLMKQRTVVLADRIGGCWMGLPAQISSRTIGDAVPVRMASGVELFDTLRIGHDGVNGWFDRIDQRTDARIASWLRASCSEGVKPRDLKRKGLTPAHRAAYAMNYVKRIKTQQDEQAPQDAIEMRIRDALGHGGATFVSYVEHRDGYRVTFHVNGQQHISSVNKNDLTVQSAGICLSGEDQKFDLASLVGVLREPDAMYAW